MSRKMEAKKVKWCPQHGYPLPCAKCGLGLEELGYEKGKKAGMKKVVEWIEANFEPTVPMTLDYNKWHAKLKEWGLQQGGQESSQ